MERKYNKYIYERPVMLFGKCIDNNWRGETMAPTEKKAKSNLTYQVKTQMNIMAGTRISLPGKIKMVN